MFARPSATKLTRRLAPALVALMALGPASASASPGARHPARASGFGPDRVSRTGTAPVTRPLDRRSAPGWAGSRLFGWKGNDWEPIVAADPNAPYVYMLTTRFSGHRACSTCTKPPIIALRISSDGGKTFGHWSYLCTCPGENGGQGDPQIAVAADGSVYAVWIDGAFRDVLSRSTDYGQTWSDPVRVASGIGYQDHPWLAVSPSGQDVFVAFNHADSYIAQSHDFGVTWEPPIKTNRDRRYHYAGGGYVADDGTVTFSQASYPLHRGYTGKVKMVATRSTDGGATWQTATVDRVGLQPRCLSRGCPANHLGGHASLGADATGDLVIAYDGAVVSKGPQYIYVRRSTDGGLTWGRRERVSPGGDVVAAFPAIVGTGEGDYRLWYMDDRKGTERWNVWFRRSRDGGRRWGHDVRISDARRGAGYVHARGFDADYGDYGGIAVTQSGETFAAWGEGYSYNGPGGTWYNRTR